MSDLWELATREMRYYHDTASTRPCLCGHDYEDHMSEDRTNASGFAEGRCQVEGCDVCEGYRERTHMDDVLDDADRAWDAAKEGL